MKSCITNILFTTDLSENSSYAMRHAVSLLKQTGAELHVLHVSEPVSDDVRSTLQMFIQDESARQDMLRKRSEGVKELLKDRQSKFWANLPSEDQNLREQIGSIEVVEGYPAEAILRRAEELGCDLIILGAHDHGFTHTFLGTVAKRVLRRAAIPTLVVPYVSDA